MCTSDKYKLNIPFFTLHSNEHLPILVFCSIWSFVGAFFSVNDKMIILQFFHYPLKYVGVNISLHVTIKYIKCSLKSLQNKHILTILKLLHYILP
jgi:hypothetical protein